MIYYEVLLYEDKNNNIDLPRYIPGVSRIKWLEYNEDDGGLEVGQQREDESLAMKILVYNHRKGYNQLLEDEVKENRADQMISLVQNQIDLEKVINGKYEKVIVKKYKS